MGEQRKSYKSYFQKIALKILESLFTGIVLAIVASLLSSHILFDLETKKQVQNRLQLLSNIYIGSNLDWVNDNFGKPQFTALKDGYTLCAYISDYYVLQIAYDSDESTRAYLITSLENEDGIKINITDYTIKENTKIKIGSMSYYDVFGKPESTMGMCSNGVIRFYYYEQYYYASYGNYYNYFFATLDYGLNADMSLFYFNSKEEDYKDDELKDTKVTGYFLPSNRHDSYPNSYGVADLSDGKCMDLLLGFKWFNSLQLLHKANSFNEFPKLSEDTP